MADEVKVNWYKQKAVLSINKKFEGFIGNLAFRIEERTKVNINEAPGASGQGLIDTGFMINSTYVVLPGKSTYGQAQKTGMYKNRQGEMVQREIAPEIQLHNYAAAMVAVGANYAIFQEIKHGFLMKAVEEAWKEAGSLLKAVGRKEERL